MFVVIPVSEDERVVFVVFVGLVLRLVRVDDQWCSEAVYVLPFVVSVHPVVKRQGSETRSLHLLLLPAHAPVSSVLLSSARVAELAVQRFI